MRFLFVVGCGRSGTTLVQQILHAHPDVAVVPETHFVPRFWLPRARWGDLRDDASWNRLVDDWIAIPVFADMRLSAEAFRAAARAPTIARDPAALLRLTMETWAAGKGATLAGEKTPIHGLHMGTLARLFPGARFVDVVRDPRAVVASRRGLPWRNRERASTPAAEAETWRHHVAASVRPLPGGVVSLHTLHYEALVADPEPAARALCAFLRIPFAPEMLEFHRREPAALNLEREPWKANAARPLTREPADRWKTTLSDEDVRAIEAVAWREMRRSGYALATPAARLLPAAARVWTGRTVRAVRRRASVRRSRAGAGAAAEGTALEARRLRVVMVPDWSGANPYQRCLAGGLAAAGVDAELGAPAGGVAPLLEATGGGADGRRADILHLHWTHPYLIHPGGGGARSAIKTARFLAELAAIRGLGTRIVWTVHNLVGHGSRQPDVERQGGVALARLASRIIVHCDAARPLVSETLRLGPAAAARLRVVPHGSYRGVYVAELSRADARRQLGLEPETRVFAFLGELRDYKGLGSLCAAIRDVPDPRLRIVIAGLPRDAAVVADVARAAEADPRIHFRPGWVFEKDVQAILGAADAAILPFRDVLTSGAAVLAQSFGLPVIAPRLGCLADAVGDDAGILYDATRPDALREAIVRALAADLRPLAARATARAGDASVDWRHIGALTRTVYDEIVTIPRR